MTETSPTPSALYEAHYTGTSLRDQPYAIAGIVLACSITALLVAVAGIRLHTLARKKDVAVPAASVRTEQQPVSPTQLMSAVWKNLPSTSEERDVRESPSPMANRTTVQVDVHDEERSSSPEVDIPTIIYEEAFSYNFTKSVSNFSSLSEGSCTRVEEVQGTPYTLHLTEVVPMEVDGTD